MICMLGQNGENTCPMDLMVVTSKVGDRQYMGMKTISCWIVIECRGSTHAVQCLLGLEENAHLFEPVTNMRTEWTLCLAVLNGAIDRLIAKLSSRMGDCRLCLYAVDQWPDSWHCSYVRIIWLNLLVWCTLYFCADVTCSYCTTMFGMMNMWIAHTHSSFDS